MQELIEKSKVLNLIKDIKNQTLGLSEILELFNKIHSLPTTVHHEYKVGELMDFSEEGEEWHTGPFDGFKRMHDDQGWKFIRTHNSEHPDIIQARELASRHGLKLTKI